MKQGFIIPVYKHAVTAVPLAEKLHSMFNLPVILVDDGNNSEEKKILADGSAGKPWLSLVTLSNNLGKGGAVIKGLQKAKETGLTHAFQIDADGQHELENVSLFLKESEKNPDKIICGCPSYDDSVPKHRLNGRKISNTWAAIVTLSGRLTDVLCGYRVYPVEKTLRVTGNPFLDKRMGFDPEILVRLYWSGVFPIYHPVKVIYPEGGISNFHNVKDNIRISWMFTRLCIGMLIRFPYLLVLRIKERNNETGRK
jgi:glycosyltransferase involved in cell wall biosynthesis